MIPITLVILVSNTSVVFLGVLTPWRLCPREASPPPGFARESFNVIYDNATYTAQAQDLDIAVYEAGMMPCNHVNPISTSYYMAVK